MKNLPMKGVGGVRVPPTTGAPLRRRWSGVAQRGNRLLRRGAGRRLRWVLAQGRCWVCLWLRPEPLPKRGDSITVHIYDPSQCRKLPSIPPFQHARGRGVRDVTGDEARVHGWKIGHRVSRLRNGAITRLRQLDDWRLPDARRAMVSQSVLAFALLGA
jgi:hypothetical protein